MEPENVNHPEHYSGDTTYEAIKVIHAWGLGFDLGNVVKYICRWDKKGDPLENLRKARFYLDQKIIEIEDTRARAFVANTIAQNPLRPSDGPQIKEV